MSEQIAGDLGQPQLVGGIPAGGAGMAAGTRWSSRFLPTQTFLWFYVSNEKAVLLKLTSNFSS